MPDSFRRLVVELTSILTLTTRTPLTQNYAYRGLQRARTMPPLRALYHSIHLSERISMRPPPTIADAWLEIYPSFFSADSYRYATTLWPIPFDSSRPADSDKVLPDSIRLLVVELTSFLTFSAQVPPTQNFAYRELQCCYHFEPYTIQFVSASGFQ